MSTLGQVESGSEGQFPAFAPSTDIQPKLLEIRVWPDPILHKLSMPIEDRGPLAFGSIELRQLIADMFHTMLRGNGVGLAAPQVGISRRVITMEIEPGKSFYFINPVIVESSEVMYQWEEGCLSVPGYFETRKRPNDITVWTYDTDGKLLVVRLQGLYAFALQHEMDHLAGKVFVDDLSSLKKERVKTKIKNTLQKRARFPL